MSVVVVVGEEGVVLLALLAGFPGPRFSISHFSAGSRLYVQRHTNYMDNYQFQVVGNENRELEEQVNPGGDGL